MYLPSNVSEPKSAEDMETLRACLRYNEELDCGFLFINNHQRKRHMTQKWITSHKPLEFSIRKYVNQAYGFNDKAGETADKNKQNTDDEYLKVTFKNIYVASDAVLVIPYNLPVKIDGEDIRLRYTNASYLGCFGGVYYFYSDENEKDVYFEWSDNADHSGAVRLLTTHDAEHLLVGKDGKISMLPDLAFEKAGTVDFVEMNVKPEKDTFRLPVDGSTLSKECEHRKACGCVREYELSLKYDAVCKSCGNAASDCGKESTPDDKSNERSDGILSDIFLELDFGGDKAELYADGRLIDDWFSNGEVWRVALRRYGFPKKLVLKVYPFDDKVYYDLEPKKGCRFNGAKLTRVI